MRPYMVKLWEHIKASGGELTVNKAGRYLRTLEGFEAKKAEIWVRSQDSTNRAIRLFPELIQEKTVAHQKQGILVAVQRRRLVGKQSIAK